VLLYTLALKWTMETQRLFHKSKIIENNGYYRGNEKNHGHISITHNLNYETHE
jgi:hypothetical protein